MRAEAALAKKPKFCDAALPRADIFYIVKRGSTWDFLQPQALKVLVEEAAYPG